MVFNISLDEKMWIGRHVSLFFQLKCMPKFKNGSPNQIDRIKWFNAECECGVGHLEIFSAYPRLFWVFFSVFPVYLNAQDIKQV